MQPGQDIAATGEPILVPASLGDPVKMQNEVQEPPLLSVQGVQAGSRLFQELRLAITPTRPPHSNTNLIHTQSIHVQYRYCILLYSVSVQYLSHESILTGHDTTTHITVQYLTHSVNARALFLLPLAITL